MTKYSCFLILVLGFAFVFAGCGMGSGTCTVSGKVTVKEKPVYTGVISFYGANGEFVSGGIDTEGNYLVYDVPVGVMKVAVVSNKPSTDAERARKNEAGAPPMAAPPPVEPAKWFAIDAKYADPETSGKTATLTSGTNKIDVTLE